MGKTSKKLNKNYESVIIEEMKSQFKAYGEGFSTLSEQFEEFKEVQDVLVVKVDKLEVGQKVLFGKVDNLEKGQKVLIKKVEVLQDDVTEIKHKLSQKVDLEEFQKLEDRVVKLEKLVLSAA